MVLEIALRFRFVGSQILFTFCYAFLVIRIYVVVGQKPLILKRWNLRIATTFTAPPIYVTSFGFSLCAIE